MKYTPPNQRLKLTGLAWEQSTWRVEVLYLIIQLVA